MKTAIVCLLLFFAVSAFSQGAAIMSREKARSLANQNNARQGVAPASQPAQPSQPAATAPPATPPSLPQLKTDLAAIKVGETVSPELKQKLASDIVNGAQSTKPAQAAANKLAEDLANAFAAKPLPSANLTRLVQQIDALINPSKFPQAKPQGIYDAIQNAFVENGLDQKRAIAIVDDLKALNAH
jgi:hypothetical protein